MVTRARVQAHARHRELRQLSDCTCSYCKQWYDLALAESAREKEVKPWARLSRTWSTCSRSAHEWMRLGNPHRQRGSRYRADLSGESSDGNDCNGWEPMSWVVLACGYALLMRGRHARIRHNGFTRRVAPLWTAYVHAARKLIGDAFRAGLPTQTGGLPWRGRSGTGENAACNRGPFSLRLVVYRCCKGCALTSAPPL